MTDYFAYSDFWADNRKSGSIQSKKSFIIIIIAFNP
jgi:hypothetical protein